MPYGEQALPVKSEVAPVETTTSFCALRAISCTASIADEFGTSKTASTLSASNHLLTMFAAISGLF